jgi:hypothetical protein
VVTGTAGEHAEADLVIPDGVLPVASQAAGPIYAEFHAGANLIGTDEERGGAIFLAGLLEVLAAGWVLVPGPVRTEWAVNRPVFGGFVVPTSTEAAARSLVASTPEQGTVVSRLVTEWRPDPESAVCGDPHPDKAGYRCQKPPGHAMPHLTLQSGSADAWAPEPTQDGDPT